MSDSGGRPQSVTDEDILRYFRESGEHVLTTSEVADGVDVSRRTALRRLARLADEGAVRRKDVGDRSAVWWLPDSADEPAPTSSDDPFMNAETFSSGRSGVSESVDDELAAAVNDENGR
ncbi:winged helix-turn-helix transcriptional regulator [Halosimplex sp. TS25]|uniref:winged helix-turn-helix transcriptional regulator n=1 Tax=Halosimplex rarum TaxID=3396619 RepID=UPI0039E88053